MSVTPPKEDFVFNYRCFLSRKLRHVNAGMFTMHSKVTESENEFVYIISTYPAKIFHDGNEGLVLVTKVELGLEVPYLFGGNVYRSNSEPMRTMVRFDFGEAASVHFSCFNAIATLRGHALSVHNAVQFMPDPYPSTAHLSGLEKVVAEHWRSERVNLDSIGYQTVV